MLFLVFLSVVVLLFLILLFLSLLFLFFLFFKSSSCSSPRLSSSCSCSSYSCSSTSSSSSFSSLSLLPLPSSSVTSSYLLKSSFFKLSPIACSLKESLKNITNERIAIKKDAVDIEAAQRDLLFKSYKKVWCHFKTISFRINYLVKIRFKNALVEWSWIYINFLGAQPRESSAFVHRRRATREGTTDGKRIANGYLN